MPVERTFIKRGLKRVELETFLVRELGQAGYGGVDVKRVPTGTRVALYVDRPGMVIGRKGRSIKLLTEELEKKFGLENPQIEVIEIPRSELSGPIMAKRIAFALERGLSARRIGHIMTRRIMEAGARGVEVTISGRIAGERSRSERFYKGYISKAGEPAEKLVSRGYAEAKLKPGIAGVKVDIMPPDAPLPDEIKVKETKPVEAVVTVDATNEDSKEAEKQTQEGERKSGDTEG
ncbi:MAG TPA: 30S ribosomal protein S3 [Hadesarchaea archaeon]|nr:30S ribosomal protein S3 [Hadesarchaea archaeon]